MEVEDQRQVRVIKCCPLQELQPLQILTTLSRLKTKAILITTASVETPVEGEGVV